MALVNRGTKLHCSHCGVNFYDLDRSPVVCPKCHQAYVAPPPRLPPSRNTRAAAAAAAAVVVPLVAEVEENRFQEDETVDADVDAEVEEDEDEEEEGEDIKDAEE
jgi:uncharacterized protein (TIGR02300 family)